MSREAYGHQDPEWEAFVDDLESGRDREATIENMLMRLYEVLEAKSDRVDELIPGDVAANINLALKDEGWPTQWGVVPLDPDEVAGLKDEDKADFYIDVLTEDPVTNLVAAIQVGFTIPKRSRVMAVNCLYPSPDCSVFVQTRYPYSRSKVRMEDTLATALRDVEVPFRVYHMLMPWGEPILMDNDLRDRVRLRKKRKKRKQE